METGGGGKFTFVDTTDKVVDATGKTTLETDEGVDTTGKTEAGDIITVETVVETGAGVAIAVDTILEALDKVETAADLAIIEFAAIICGSFDVTPLDVIHTKALSIGVFPAFDQ